MSNLFTYDVIIQADASILKSGQFAESIPSCAQISIKSEEFKEYEECEASLADLLASLSYVEANLSSRNMVIMSKLNPALGTTTSVDPGAWDKFTVSRSYIADAELLQESKLKYSIFGQVNIVPQSRPAGMVDGPLTRQ